MQEKDNLPTIIASIALLSYIAFLFIMTRPTAEEPLQGGDIQKALETNQLD